LLEITPPRCRRRSHANNSTMLSFLISAPIRRNKPRDSRDCTNLEQN
jgi:hypothetical protein